MPADLPRSEFGGKVQENTLQPPPHEPTSSELLRQIYRTGSEDGTAPPDEGRSWHGLSESTETG